MKPAINIIGMTHQTNTPPAKITSTVFIATSIDIMDIKDIPVAVLNASSAILAASLKFFIISLIIFLNPELSRPEFFLGSTKVTSYSLRLVSFPDRFDLINLSQLPQQVGIVFLVDSMACLNV